MQENSRVITDELLEAFLQCKYKARLRALGRGPWRARQPPPATLTRRLIRRAVREAIVDGQPANG